MLVIIAENNIVVLLVIIAENNIVMLLLIVAENNIVVFAGNCCRTHNIVDLLLKNNIVVFAGNCCRNTTLSICCGKQYFCFYCQFVVMMVIVAGKFKIFRSLILNFSAKIFKILTKNFQNFDQNFCLENRRFFRNVWKVVTFDVWTEKIVLMAANKLFFGCTKY